MKLAFISCLMLLWKISNANEQLSDFPACGFRNEASTVHPFLPERVQRRDECLWDCDWVDNPFYRTNWTIHLVDNYLNNPDNPNEKVVFENVKYFMMTPKIPKNLTCLDGCRLPVVVSQNRVNCKPEYQKSMTKTCEWEPIFSWNKRLKRTAERSLRVIWTAILTIVNEMLSKQSQDERCHYLFNGEISSELCRFIKCDITKIGYWFLEQNC